MRSPALPPPAPKTSDALLLELVADNCCCDPSLVKRSSTFAELDYDSLDLVELVMDVEARLGIVISDRLVNDLFPDEDQAKRVTVEMFVVMVNRIPKPKTLIPIFVDGELVVPGGHGPSKLKVVPDEAVPVGEIRFEVGGVVVGKIVNIGVE